MEDTLAGDVVPDMRLHMTAAMLALACVAGSACRRHGAVRFDTADAHWSQPTNAPAAMSGIRTEAPAPPSRPAQVAYPLDNLERTLPRGQLSCPAVDAREYPGGALRFSPPARVIEPFRERLLVFEQVVREVSERIYGRSPSAILVAASYGCRSVGGQNHKLSEHALGNAIDITGFDFAPSPWAPPAWLSGHLPLLGGFEVRVDRHWKANDSAIATTHAYFLEELTRQLVQRGVFRTLLGPAQPDHHDHFHFDMAPWNYVNL